MLLSNNKAVFTAFKLVIKIKYKRILFSINFDLFVLICLCLKILLASEDVVFGRFYEKGCIVFQSENFKWPLI